MHKPTTRQAPETTCRCVFKVNSSNIVFGSVSVHFCRGWTLLRYNAVQLTWNGLQTRQPIRSTIFLSLWRSAYRAYANNRKFTLFTWRKNSFWQKVKPVTTFSVAISRKQNCAAAGKCRLQWRRTWMKNMHL